MSKNFSDYDNLTSLFTEIRNKNVDIEKNIAPVESDASSSSRVYAVNSRLILGDKLYKVIAAIDIGDALIVGTNIELSSNLVTLIGQGGGGGETYYAGPGINISDDNVISSKAVEFAGTQAEWDALSTQEKSVFDYINITDDTSEETYQPGHSISDGTSEKTQREVLEFEGFTVTDDSVNGKTKVAEVPYTAGDGVEITEKEISVSDEISRTWTGTKAEWDAIADKSVYDGWIINITDDQASGVGVVVDEATLGNMSAITSNAVAKVVDRGSVEVIADGTKTWGQLIASLHSEIDESKLTKDSVVKYSTSAVTVFFRIVTIGVSWLGFSSVRNTSLPSANSLVCYMLFNTSGSAYTENTNGTAVDHTSDVVSAGSSLTLYY